MVLSPARSLGWPRSSRPGHAVKVGTDARRCPSGAAAWSSRGSCSTSGRAAVPAEPRRVLRPTRGARSGGDDDLERQPLRSRTSGHARARSISSSRTRGPGGGSR
jgi:hypothetical protein